MMGVDACPMEGFEPAKFDAILGLKEQGYSAVVLAAAGYRAADDPFASLAKVRFEPDRTVKHV
jgi:nitroreductase